MWFSVPSAKQRKISSKVPSYRDIALAVRLPAKVRFCIQRKQRKQVLFALDRAGYRGSAPKRHYIRNSNSQYRC